MTETVQIKGYSVLLDQEDVARIAPYTWTVVRNKDKNVQGRVYFHRYLGTFNGKPKREYLHRFLISCPEGLYTDHINRNTLDCRKENLRACEHHVNMVNRSMQINNSSGVTGVSWLEGKKKWRARITVNKKVFDLGFFHTKEEAVNKRKEGELMFGYDALRVAV